MKKKLLSLFCLVIIFNLFFSFNTYSAYADAYTDKSLELINKLELSEIEGHFNQIEDFNFYNLLKSIIKGENKVDFNSIFDYVKSTIFNNVKKIMPTFLTIISICIICAVIGELKGSFLENSISQTIYFVCFLCIASLILLDIINLYKNTLIVINNLTKTIEIMSPIMLTLMVASGQSASATLYNPAVVFLSNGIVTIFISIVMPLIALQGVFSLINNFSADFKLNKFIDFISSCIKWILGLSVTVFGFFLTTNGIASASFDGISIKLANYTISNTVPIVGGFVKDGFNVMVTCNYLIKNSIGVVGLIGVFYIILSPVINMLSYSILLKFTAGVLEPFNLSNVSSFCTSTSKFITHLILVILIVGILFFITILLMIFSTSIF